MDSSGKAIIWQTTHNRYWTTDICNVFNSYPKASTQLAVALASTGV